MNSLAKEMINAICQTVRVQRAVEDLETQSAVNPSVFGVSPRASSGQDWGAPETLFSNLTPVGGGQQLWLPGGECCLQSVAWGPLSHTITTL